MIVVGISIVGMNMMIPEMMLIMIDEDEITSKSQYQVLKHPLHWIQAVGLSESEIFM